MKSLLAIRLAAVVAMLATLGCASHQPRSVPVVHQKLDTSVISRPIAAARAKIGNVSTNIAEASERLDTASSLVSTIAKEGAAPGSATAAQLGRELEQTRAALFRAQADLRDSAGKLADADTRTAELDQALETQTAAMNRLEDRCSTAEYKVADLAEENSKLRSQSFWGKVRSWAFGVGTLLLVAAGFFFKVIGLGSRVALRAAL